MSADDLLRQGASKYTAADAAADQKRTQAEAAERARKAAKEAEGLELVKRFLELMALAGNPGLEYPGFGHFECWGNLITPLSHPGSVTSKLNALMLGVPGRTQEWVGPEHWMRENIIDTRHMQDGPGGVKGSTITMEDGLSSLAERLGKIMAKNNVRVP